MLTDDVSTLIAMDESFGQRVLRLRKARGMSQEALADAIGVKRATVTMWETEATGMPEGQNLVRAAEVLGVAPAYLESGREDERRPMFARAGGMQTRDVPVIGFAIANPTEEGYFDDMGFPPGAGEAYLPWPTRDRDAYALRVRGDSMQDRIRHGDLIVVEPNSSPAIGDDVVVRTKAGRKMVKRLRNRQNGEITLGSINQAHRDLTISIEEVESVHRIAAIVARGTFTKE